MKKGFIIAAAVLTVVGIALFAGAFASAGFDLSKIGSSKYETKTYAVDEDFLNIEINAETTDVVFKLSEDGKFSVVCEEKEKVGHAVRVEDGTLKISVEDERSWLDFISFFGNKTAMTVYLPSGSYGSISVNVSTGDVTLTDVKCASFSTDGSTGDVTLKNVAADSFVIGRSTGDVKFDRCDAGMITVKTSTGDVTGTLSSDMIFRTDTSTGDVDVPDTATGGVCMITTTTGDIDIKIKK